MIKISTRQRLKQRLFLFMLAGFFTFSVVAEPLITDQQKSSYALGVDYMSGLQRDAMLLDNQAFLQGIKDIQSGKGSKLNAQQTQRALDFFIVERLQHRREQMIDTRLQGENFLQQNRYQNNVKALSSGLQYIVLQSGNSQTHPSDDAGVAVRYRLFDLDGNELLSSFTHGNAPKRLAVNQLISGWRQVLPLMSRATSGGCFYRRIWLMARRAVLTAKLNRRKL